jgi:lipopolysaccharide transport system permease protein
MQIRFATELWKHKQLWRRLTERDILGRYRGSAMGIGWAIITPLAMLSVYTFVFSQVFRARWGEVEGQGSFGFAINMFAGLIVFNIFAETANRSPTLITSCPSYVKKVVFPLEILSAVCLGSALFHGFIGLIILCLAQLAVAHTVSLTALFLPLVWIPLVLGSLGLSLLLAASGVFIRDISQIVSVAVSISMFLSPIFFPISALPERWRPLLSLNPIAPIIEETRRVLLLGNFPDPLYVVTSCILSLLFCETCYRMFEKSKRGFADVI